MNSLKLSAVALAIAALGTSALAQSAAGTWNGRIEIGKIPLPPNAPPQARQRMEQGMAMVKKATITLTLKKDKTCTILTKGFGKDDAENGTWSQKGNSVTITTKKKGPGGKDSQTMVLSPNGKTMTMTPPTGGGPAVKVIFTKK